MFHEVNLPEGSFAKNLDGFILLHPYASPRSTQKTVSVVPAVTAAAAVAAAADPALY